jgi:hypothetical protein
MALSLSFFPIFSVLLLVLSHIAGAATVVYDFNITWVRGECSCSTDVYGSLIDIRKANPDGQSERPTIGINGYWPLPVMTATINDTVVVNVNNLLGKHLLTPCPFSKDLCLIDCLQETKQPLSISTVCSRMVPQIWTALLKSANVGLNLDLNSLTTSP